jgi:competence CoiA-like predicted nuclease
MKFNFIMNWIYWQLDASFKILRVKYTSLMHENYWKIVRIQIMDVRSIIIDNFRYVLNKIPERYKYDDYDDKRNRESWK